MSGGVVMPSESETMSEILAVARRVLADAQLKLRFEAVDIVSNHFLGPMLRLRPERYVGDYSDDSYEATRAQMAIRPAIKEAFGIEIGFRLLNVAPDDVTLRGMVARCQREIEERYADRKFVVLPDRFVEFNVEGVTQTFILVGERDCGLTPELVEAVSDVNQCLFCGANDKHPNLMAVDARLFGHELREHVRSLLKARRSEHEAQLKEAGVSQAFFEMMTPKLDLDSLRIRCVN